MKLVGGRSLAAQEAFNRTTGRYFVDTGQVRRVGCGIIKHDRFAAADRLLEVRATEGP